MSSVPATAKPAARSGGRARGTERDGPPRRAPRPAMASLLKVDPEVKLKVPPRGGGGGAGPEQSATCAAGPPHGWLAPPPPSPRRAAAQRCQGGEGSG